MAEDLNQRIEQAAQGITPQTKPDERRRFLGSLRERAVLRLSVSETNDLQATKLFLAHLQDYKDYTVLINGNMKQNDFINEVMSACSNQKIKFTLISDETAQTDPQATGILIVAKQAVNRYRIGIKQVYAPDLPTPRLTADEPKKKSHFWSKIFGRKS